MDNRSMNDSTDLIKKDIDILLERLIRLKDIESNRNEIEEIKLELARLNERASELERLYELDNKTKENTDGYNVQIPNIQEEQKLSNSELNNSNVQITNEQTIQSNTYNGGYTGNISNNQWINSVQYTNNQGYRNNMPPVNFGYNQNNCRYTNNVSKLPPNTKPINNSDIEKNIGTNVMSILSAILIFVGIASLTVILYNSFNDIMKSLLLIGLTVLVSSVGFLLLKRKQSIFSYSITAIGVGGVYISIIASGVMNVFNLYIIIVLVIAWTCFIHWMNLKYNSFVLELTELIGFDIAIILGLVKVLDVSVYADGCLLVAINVGYIIGLEYSCKLKGNYKKAFDVILALEKLKLEIILMACFWGHMGLSKLAHCYSVDNLFEIIVNTLLYCVPFLMLGYTTIKGIKNILKNEEYYKYPGFLCLISIIYALMVGILGMMLLTDVILNSDSVYVKEVSGVYCDFIGIFLLMYCYFIRENGLKRVGDTLSKTITLIIMGMGLLLNSVQLMILDETIVKLSIVGGVITNLIVIAIVSSFVLKFTDKTNDRFYRKLGLIFILIRSISYNSIASDVDKCVFFERYRPKDGLVWIALCMLVIVLTIMVLRIMVNYIKDFSKYKNIFDKSICMIIIDIIVTCAVNFICDYSGIEYRISAAILAIIIIIITLVWNRLNYFTSYNNMSELLIKNKDITNRDKSYVVFLVFNACLMLLLLPSSSLNNVRDYTKILSTINDSKEIILNTIYSLSNTVLILVFAYIGNDYVLKKSKRYGGFIIGIKYAIIINVLMHSHITYYTNVTSIVYSMIILMMSLLFIVYGWVISNKSSRLFGLVGVMFSIAKLLFFDIQFENSLAKTVAYIVSGILCALIVWIYDKVSDKNHVKEHFSS